MTQERPFEHIDTQKLVDSFHLWNKCNCKRCQKQCAERMEEIERRSDKPTDIKLAKYTHPNETNHS